MFNPHPLEGFLPTQSELSRAAAERYAILTALRECRRSQRRSATRRRAGR
jgi:hypothetical protein